MTEKATQFRIGLFVLVGVAIVLGALVLFGIRTAFQPVDMFETYTTGDVEGLSVGSVVKLRGVEVGKVTEIGFSWNMYDAVQPACVVVRCAVRQHIAPAEWRNSNFQTELQKIVNSGLRAVVQMEGITGSSVVSLQTLDPKTNPPLAVPWTPKYPYIPSAPSQLGRLLASLEKTASNLEKIDAGRLSATLTRALGSADTFLQKLNQLDVGAISQGAQRTINNADGAVLEIKGLVQDARAQVQGMKLEAVGTDADALVKNLDARLGSLIERLNAIDIRSLNDTLEGTREAARSLNEALDALKRYPSGFLLGGAPPPAPALQEEKK